VADQHVIPSRHPRYSVQADIWTVASCRNLPVAYDDQKVLSALATEAERNQLFGLGFTVSPTGATADTQDQARVEPTNDIAGIADDLNVRLY
jgi:hypothetical protein